MYCISGQSAVTKLIASSCTRKGNLQAGDMPSTAAFQINAGNGGGMQKPGSMLPWSVYMARISEKGGGRGSRWTRGKGG